MTRRRTAADNARLTDLADPLSARFDTKPLITVAFLLGERFCPYSSPAFVFGSGWSSVVGKHLPKRAHFADSALNGRGRSCGYLTGAAAMTTEELLAALRAAAAQGDEKAAWMLRMLIRAG